MDSKCLLLIHDELTKYGYSLLDLQVVIRELIANIEVEGEVADSNKTKDVGNFRKRNVLLQWSATFTSIVSDS